MAFLPTSDCRHGNRDHCGAGISVERIRGIGPGKAVHERTPMKAPFLLVALAGAALLLVGCNTVKGLGRDIQSAGQAGEEAIKGNKE
jgi:predicted small secreted protein